HLQVQVAVAVGSQLLFGDQKHLVDALAVGNLGYKRTCHGINPSGRKLSEVRRGRGKSGRHRHATRNLLGSVGGARGGERGRGPHSCAGGYWLKMPRRGNTKSEAPNPNKSQVSMTNVQTPTWSLVIWLSSLNF